MIGTLSFSWGQFSKKRQLEFSLDSIPEELKKGANAVYFIDEGSYEILGQDLAKFRSRYVAVIFNEKARSLASLTLMYDKFQKVTALKGRCFDASGDLLLQLNMSDATDQSAVSNVSIFDDNRLKYLDLEHNEYPYIVEFEYEKTYKQTFSMPNWYVLSGSNRSVMKSRFSVISPLDLEPRFLITNTARVFDRHESEGLVTNSIEFNNVKSVKREPYGPGTSEFTPSIFVSPSKFSFDGYTGDFSTWESMGKWQNSLNRGRDYLPTETTEKILDITKDLDSKEEKIRAVYEYVQNNTRYVSIQLGIGGWQPFPAATVDELGYGDCKALTNYTHALLKVCGINSLYTLVYAGTSKSAIDKNFSRRQFNHAILCVPNEQDTIWLECTSQTNPFGYQGYFTGDRDVLVITPEGGKVVHTKSYEKEDNQQVTVAHIELGDNGNAMANININYTGQQFENNDLNWVINDGDEELRKWILNNMGINEFMVDDFSFELENDRIPKIKQQTTLSIHALASASGNRLFLNPNLMNRWKKAPKKVSERKTDVILNLAYQDVDSVVYNIPTKYHIEHLPEAIQFESQFGTYEANFSFEDHQLIYVRKISREKGRFPKETYESFRKFYKKVIKADKSKVVFVDKT